MPIKFHYTWSMPSIWTFEILPVKKLLKQYIYKAKHVLIPFAGITRFNDLKNIDYIDIEDNLPEPYLKGDSFQVLPELIEKKQKYDLVLFDPPYSLFQAQHKYNNKTMQDITRIKNLLIKLTEINAIIISFGFNSTGMGKKRGFEKTDIYLLNVGGSHNDFIIVIEKKCQNCLDDFITDDIFETNE